MTATKIFVYVTTAEVVAIQAWANTDYAARRTADVHAALIATARGQGGRSRTP